jgi:uncharacterized surface protein with fasciclin (FAS1) repeats
MKTFRTSLVAAVAGVALLGAACSDSDDSADEGSDATEQTTSTTEATTTTTAAEDESAASGDTIVDVAAGNEDFSTLVQLVTDAGLAETLSGEGPYTVFAPTNAAFAAVPAETLDALAADPQGALTEVLTLHVVEGEVMAADAAGLVGQCVETVNGGKLKVEQSGDTLTIGGAPISATDVEASNGVIHVIDAVITAPSADC